MPVINEEFYTNTDAILSVRENLEYSAKDEDLIVAVNKAIQESKSLKEEIDERGKRNKLYWKTGTESDLSRFHRTKAKITSNRIFTDVETAIPILTSEPPEPTILGDINNEISEDLQKGLQIAYEVEYKMQQKLQCLVRHWFLFLLGVLKYRWEKGNGFITENVLTRKIGFDPRATCMVNCEYIFEEMEDTIEHIQDKFPKAKDVIKNSFANLQPKNKVKYYEFWGGQGEWVCWKLQNIILDKKKNPNFDYGEKAKGTEESLDYIPATEGVNLFKRPQFPYIFLNVFSFGDQTGLYDETSLIEECQSLQEGVNQLERQILDLNEGQKRVWVVSGEAMSQIQADKLLNETGDVMVYLDRKAPAGSVTQVQSGKPDASLFNHLTHLLGEIDNTIGIHATTRGALPQRQETLGGQKMQVGQDFGRLDLIVRNIEQVMEEWYFAYLQMLKVYQIEPVSLTDGKVSVEINPEEIPIGIKVMVKKGSTLPVDKVTKREDAITLAQMDKIDPETLFNELGYPRPEERTQKLFQWLQMTGKIIPQPQMAQGGGDQQKLEQVQRLKAIMEKTKQLPPEEQEAMAGKVGEAIRMMA